MHINRDKPLEHESNPDVSQARVQEYKTRIEVEALYFKGCLLGFCAAFSMSNKLHAE